MTSVGLTAPQTISTVIPARNEARLIGGTLAALRRVLSSYEAEIVVVDNGSTDDTTRIAESFGARVITAEHGTIGALRNLGVAVTSGRILIFLDADVVLTDAWAKRFAVTLESLLVQPRQLTGAMCTVPSTPSWLERIWFAPRDMMVSSHIGTGHLVTTRAFFDELQGFDERLATGEDYDFSHRALAAGGSVSPDPLLVAEHHGFPRTLAQFVRREAWHGRSDFESLYRIIHSRVALATLAFAGAWTLVLTGAIVGSTLLALAGVVLSFGLCLLSSALKFRRQPALIVLANGGVFHAYYFGRLLAMLRLSVNRASPRVAAEGSLPPQSVGE